MPRQLQGNTAPAAPVDITVPIEKGGTGVTTSDALLTLVGGISRAKLGQAGGLVKADSQGKLPAELLASAGVVLGYSLDGPVALVYGQTAIFTITNYNSSATIDVSVSAGSVVRVDEEIRVTAPMTGDSVILTVDGRSLTLPVQSMAPIKPTVLYPAVDTTVTGTLTVYSAPFQSVVDTYGDWTMVSSSGDTVVAIPAGAIGVVCEGEKGESGTAAFTVSSTTHSLGQTYTWRRVNLTTETTVTFSRTGTGSLRYRFVYAMATHASTDWQIASDAAFTTIIKESLADTVNLTAWPVTLPEGTYYIRSRFNGSAA